MKHAFLVAAVFVGGCMPSCESEKDKQKRHNQSIVWVSLYDKFLRQLHDATPEPASLGQKDCDDAAIAPKVKDLLSPELCLVDWEFLDRYVSAKPDVGDDDPWRWLRSSDLRHPQPPSAITNPADAETQGAAFQSIKRDCPFVGVWRATARALPEVGRGDDFGKGRWGGSLVVFDRDTAKPVCWAHVAAESSATPPHKEHLSTGLEARKDDLDDDFRDQLEHAARSSLARISKKLTLELPTIF